MTFTNQTLAKITKIKGYRGMIIFVEIMRLIEHHQKKDGYIHHSDIEYSDSTYRIIEYEIRS